MAWYWADIANGLFFLMSLLAPSLLSSDDAVASSDDAADTLEVFGTEDSDDLMAQAQGQTTFLLGGDDMFEGTAGVDTAFGGAGDDVMLMRQGDDTAEGGLGADRIDGGIGNDTLSGGEGDDWLNGAAGNDTVSGGAGDDEITGSSGVDTLRGGAGDDVLHGNVLGASTAQDGADMLFGDEGADTLYLSSNDMGEGGADGDTFVIEETIEPGENATITDFDASEDQITVRYETQTDPVTGDPIVPELSTSNYEEGVGSTISIGGTPILNIDGQADFDVSTITLEGVPA